MLDRDVVAVSPSSVYRVLKAAGRLSPWKRKPSSKGKGFTQPTRPHEHWHIDISHLNICGTFYYLCSLLDGFSRAIIHWEIREAMTEKDVEIIVQRALESFPGQRPRIISDNGPQFVARDFKTFVREVGLEHVRTSPYYPQSNGKIERFHRTMAFWWGYARCYTSEAERRDALRTWLHEYNHHRPQTACGNKPPVTRLINLSGQYS
jgi:putative transposase